MASGDASGSRQKVLIAVDASHWSELAFDYQAKRAYCSSLNELFGELGKSASEGVLKQFIIVYVKYCVTRAGYVKNIHKDHTELVCFHFGELPYISPAEAYGLSADAYTDAMEGCKEQANRVKDKFVHKMKEHKLTGRVLVKFGHKPGETIVDIAQAEEVAFLIIGTRGIGMLNRMVLGSVSDYVLHHAHCPVIIASHHNQRRVSKTAP